MIKIALAGASGRMGRTIYKTLIGSDEFEIVFGVDPSQPTDLPFPVFKNFSQTTLICDCIIDFSVASSLDDILDYAIKNKTKLVLATTGHNAEQLKRLEYASCDLSIFKASNMSLGINLLASLSKEATKFLGESYDIEIIETHHNQKLDAPSGTALTLASAINSVRDNSYEYVYGRHETAHRREKNEIGIHAVRGGTVVGKHDVMFLGAGEEVILSHTAESKEVFARGALRAAKFLMSKPVGIYNMDSILGDFYAVTTVNSEQNVSLINLPKLTTEKFLNLLDIIRQDNINLDMISQTINSDGTLSASFSLSDNDLQTVIKQISPRTPYMATVGKAKISAEGAGMEHKSGVALEVLTILKGLNIKVFAITTSETKISCCIDGENLKKAENAIKKYYGI